jgi:uncharacterized protein (DUF1697 family)
MNVRSAMRTYVALLHSVVLSKERRVTMSKLEAMATAAGCFEPRTIGATGNLVFEHEDLPIDALENKLEEGFEQTFGRRVSIVLREADGWRRLVAGNPFPAEAEVAGDRVIARIARKPLDRIADRALATKMTNGERVKIVKGDLWAHFPSDPSRSRLLVALTPAKLGVGTLRNWNTLRKIAEIL